jgi:hypothetical protein
MKKLFIIIAMYLIPVLYESCDTSMSCTSHTTIYYPNYQGNFRDFKCWTDTAKKLN